jgi:hypothetical protein
MTTEFDDIYGSRFLAATDLKGAVTATIERIEYEQFTRPNQPTRTKAVAYFRNGKKGMVINKTNAATMASAFGKKFPDWVGKRVTIKPETTTFAGKPTQGLRLYPAANGQIAAPPPPQDDMDDKIPW